MKPDDAIKADEEIYRAVKRSFPSCIDEINHKVKSALFKDNNGVSVDRQGNRTRAESQQAMRAYFQQRLKAIALLYGKDINQANVKPFSAPTTGNLFHVELFADANKGPITQLQALQLADAAELIEWHDEVDWIVS